MIEIREAKQSDVHEVHVLGENVDEFHTSDQAPNFWPEQILADCVEKEDVYFLTAVNAGHVVGFIIANCSKSLSKVLIENIFVRPDMRGNTIGTLLARKIVEKAKTNGYQFISVLTPPDDAAAIKTYEKAGFAKGETFLWLDVA